MQIKEKTLQGKMSFLVDRHLSRKRAIKMLTGPLARRWCKTTWDLLYTGRYAKRKPGLNKVQDCCPCIILHIPLFLYVQFGVYKLLLKIKLWVWHRCLAPPCRSFLPFLAEFPSGAWRLDRPTDFAWASKIWTGRHSVSPLLWETGRMPVVYARVANPLSWGFISSLLKPCYLGSFLH